jgi:ABC-type amino acid transport system permease subunit
MFQVDMAFALGLIALAAGMALTVWMRIHIEHTSKFCRGVAYLIVILAFLTLLCTSYYGTAYWLKGYFGARMTGQYHQMNKYMMRKR